MVWVEHPGRRERELSHREERRNLGVAHELLLVDLGASRKGTDVTAADHVRADEGVTGETLSDTFRNEGAQGLPGGRLIVQSLGQGLAAHLPARAKLVEAEGCTEQRPRLGGVGRKAPVGVLIPDHVVAQIPGVELEPVDAGGGHEGAEHAVEIVDGGGVGDVEDGAVPVPPLPDRHCAAVVFQEQIARGKIPEDGAVRADERHDPHHHVEAKAVQLRHHGGSVGEPARVELPVAKVGRPVVIDHEHAGR